MHSHCSRKSRSMVRLSSTAGSLPYLHQDLSSVRAHLYATLDGPTVSRGEVGPIHRAVEQVDNFGVDALGIHLHPSK